MKTGCFWVFKACKKRRVTEERKIVEERTNDLSKIVFAGVLALSLIANMRKAQANLPEQYFPLHIGNSWTYSDGTEEKTFTIIGTEQINGYTYYRFNDYWGPLREGEEFLFRHDANQVLMWDSWWYAVHGEEVVRYDFTGGYWDGAFLGYCRLKQDGVDCNVPAGRFSDCINFQFLSADCGPDAFQFGEYLAPGVGVVMYVFPGGEFPCVGHEGELSTFRLISYTLITEPHCGDENHPYPVGDLNYDCHVNLFDLAIFASHWLECTAPECD